MGNFIEEIIIQGINKDVAPGALDYSGRRVLNPVRDVINGRYLTSEGQQAGKVENIRGTSQIPQVYAINQEITINGDFAGAIDPWVSDFIGSVAWLYSAGTARVNTALGGTKETDTLYLESLSGGGTLVDGQLATFRVKATIELGATEVLISGKILDASYNIIQTFTIGQMTVVGVAHEFTVMHTIPSGGRYVGIHLTITGAGTQIANVDYYKVQAGLSHGAPEGLNECIGTYENVEKNALFFWLWNSNGQHGVFKIDGSDDSVTQILADDPTDPVLNFDRYHLITGAGMIGDILTWTDNLNPQRYINVTREYAILTEQLISLAKIGPRNAPVFTTRTTDASIRFNKLCGDSFQFAYLWVYKDNEVSVLSPYSKLCTGDIYPEVSSTGRVRVLVTHSMDVRVIELLKEVRLLYRKNNEPNWYVWKQVTNFSVSNIAEYFYNNEQGAVIADDHASKLFDLVPNRSKALTIFRGRVFLNINEEGFDFVPPTIVASLGSNVTFTALGDLVETNAQTRGGFLKKNGSYLVGLFFRAPLGRVSGIVSKTTINGPALNLSDSYNINASPTLDASNIIFNKLNVALSGLGPPDSEYFIGVSKEQNYALYMQVPAHILWYVFDDIDHPADGGAAFGLVFGANTDRFYQKNVPTSTYKYVHFLLPKGLPFVPDTDCYVRFVSQGITRIERVLAVLDGDIVVTGSFGVSSWSALNNGLKGVPFIEIFKLNTTIDPFFYQIAGPYLTDNHGAFVTPTITGLEGDAYGLWMKEYNFKPYNLEKFQQIASATRKNTVTPWLFIESPSPIAKKAQTSTVETIPNQGSGITINQANGFQPDLTKSAFSKGWPVVESKPLLQNRPATLRYSDPYVEGSQINGLNSFPVDNSYDKMGQDRSPITKLIAVGNVLVAVHERHVTTIYVGEGIVRAGDTGFITKVEHIIGDDRKLVGEMGSYHAESVQEVDGQLFGFDIYRGVIWRYTVEGIIAISDFGMMNHFKEKSAAYFPYRDSLRFVSSIDPYHKEYLITLPHLYLNKQTEDLVDITTSENQTDIILDPDDDYVVGQTYRVKIVPYNQAGATSHNVSIDVYFENDSEQPIAEGISRNIASSSEDETDALYAEFLYNGEGTVTVLLSDVTEDIYVRLSIEYQAVTGETRAYNYKAKQWSHAYEFVPEFMGKVGTSVILFKSGVLYKHSASDTHNNFFGVQYSRRIEVEANPKPGKDKTWSALQVHADSLSSDDASTFKAIEVSNDYGQASYTRARDFDKLNGVYFGSIMKDVNTNPFLLPAGTVALRDGKDMRSETLNIVINNDSTEEARMQKLNILGEFSEFSA